MNQFTKQLLLCFIALMSLNACWWDGDDDDDPISEPEPEVTEVDISGTAVKGIVKNGIVSIYGVTDGVKDETPLVTGTTDANGDYSLTVEDYTGPVVVEITAGDSSTMVCDVVSGCGDVAFGEEVDLATSDFSLKAVVASVADGEAVTTNVTSLTTLAASLAEDEGIDSESAAAANSQVAALFNITGSLTELAAVDITSSSSVSGASSEAQKAAILNAALLSAALGDAADGESLGTTLSNLATSFVANGGQMVQNESEDSSAVTLAEILAEALNIIADESLADVSLDDLETTTELLLTEAESAESGTLTESEPTTPEEEDDTEAAKAMVAALRTFAMATTYDTSAEAAYLDDFGMAADLISEDDLDTILDSLDPIADILVTAVEANAAVLDETGEALTSYDYPVTDDATGAVLFTVTVAITETDTGYTYAIDTSVPATVTNSVAIDVDITATLSWAVDESSDTSFDESSGTQSESNLFTLDGELSISGSISTSNVSMTMNTATLGIDVDAESSDSWTQTTSEYTESTSEIINVTLAEVNLDVTLSQLTGDMPISFTGAIGISLDGVNVESSESETDSCDSTSLPDGATGCAGGSYSGEETIVIDEIDLSISGTFSKGDESFTASLVANLDPNPDSHSLVNMWDGYWAEFYNDAGEWISGDWADNSSSELLGETETDFVGVSAGIAFEFDLTGVDDTTGIMLTATRTGLEAALVSLNIQVGSDRLDLDLTIDGDDMSLLITDQNSNTLTITKTYDDTADTETVSGVINVDGEDIATVSEESGVLIVRYADGTLESF